MTKPARLKTPQGQQGATPGEDIKIRNKTAASPFPANEPAELLYDDFAEARGWSDGPRGRMKRWNELSVYDRLAWRKLKDSMVSGGGHLPMKKPDEGMVALTVFMEGCYVTVQVQREHLKSPGVRKALAIADEEIERQKQEKAEFEARPNIKFPIFRAEGHVH